MLTRLGYKVETCTSGADALAVFRSRPGEFDLVISDQTMPRMTGDQLAREMLAVRPDLPFVLCTGYSDVISADEAARHGHPCGAHQTLRSPKNWPTPSTRSFKKDPNHSAVHLRRHPPAIFVEQGFRPENPPLYEDKRR